MKTKATIAGHPIHPALVAFPVAFYTATVALLAAYQLGADPFWFRVALAANVAGVATAAVAAIPGSIDLFALPDTSPARTTGIRHAVFNIVALVLFAISAGLLWGQWRETLLPGAAAYDARPALVLSALGLLSTMMAGILGWKLVQTHHLGVDDTVRLPAPGQPRVTAPRAP